MHTLSSGSMTITVIKKSSLVPEFLVSYSDNSPVLTGIALTSHTWQHGDLRSQLSKQPFGAPRALLCFCFHQLGDNGRQHQCRQKMGSFPDSQRAQGPLHCLPISTSSDSPRNRIAAVSLLLAVVMTMAVCPGDRPRNVGGVGIHAHRW